MREPTIYLAGFISNGRGKSKHVLPKCAEWRQWFKEQRPGYRFIDPMDGEANASICDEGLTSNLPAKLITDRDRFSIRDADILIINTDTFGESRPLIGTMIELGWADSKRRPVLVLSSDHHYVHHPFINAIASVVTGNRQEILRWLDYVAKGL